jgi:hypothetical protein
MLRRGRILYGACGVTDIYIYMYFSFLNEGHRLEASATCCKGWYSVTIIFTNWTMSGAFLVVLDQAISRSTHPTEEEQ